MTAVAPPHTLRFLSRADVQALLPPIGRQVDLAEHAYRALARGEVEQPPKPGIHPRPDAFIHAMPAYLRDDDVAAVKWVSGYPANRERNQPYIAGVIVLNDPETGVPLAIMDAAEITAARTAAASGACIRRWAPEGWTTAAILGCGEQGRYHAELLTALNPDVRIAAYDPVAGRAERLHPCAVAVDSPRSAVEGAAVVVTAGPIVKAPEPVIAADWLAPRHLVLPLDFDFALQPAALDATGLMLVDDRAQYDYYGRVGHFAGWRAPDGSVGERLLEAPGADTNRATVVCVNLGVAALDAVFAASVYERALATDAGTPLAL